MFFLASQNNCKNNILIRSTPNLCYSLNVQRQSPFIVPYICLIYVTCPPYFKKAHHLKFFYLIFIDPQFMILGLLSSKLILMAKNYTFCKYLFMNQEPLDHIWYLCVSVFWVWIWVFGYIKSPRILRLF